MDEKPVGKWSFHVTALQEIAETKPENLRFWHYSTSKKVLGDYYHLAT